jgi:hypothetical protein
MGRVSQNVVLPPPFAPVRRKRLALGKFFVVGYYVVSFLASKR